MKVAILWSRLGPYHLARLEGARSAARERGAEVFGIEVACEDAIYEWRRIEHDRDSVTTAFPARSYESVGMSEMRNGLIRVLQGVGCQVVAVNGWSVPEARGALAWRRAAPGRRAVLMSETKRDDNRRYWWKEWPKRRIVRRCDTALVGGRAQADYLHDLGLERTRIFTGYDAVDNAYFETGAQAARRAAIDMRRQYDLPERYFLACTRFLPRKNLDGLLRAYERYCRGCKGSPWELVILGSGEQKERLYRLASHLNVESQVSWPGFIQYEMLPVFYGLASALIHAAKSEPWGLVVNEAAAARLPLLVSKTVGARYELVEDGANGYLFDPFDVDDMAKTMVKMSGVDEETRRLMGGHSAAMVRQYSPNNFGEQLMRAVELAVSLPDD